MALLGIDISKYLDMLDAPVVLVDNDSLVLAANQYALQFANKPLAECEKNPLGKIFECAEARKPGGCGHAVHCSGCVIRTTVMEVFRTGTPVSCRPAVLNQESQEGIRPVSLLISAKKDGDIVLLKIQRADPDSPGSST